MCCSNLDLVERYLDAERLAFSANTVDSYYRDLVSLVRFADDRAITTFVRSDLNDFIGEPYSAIVDHRWTSISHKKTIKIHYWYDNEWGYSSRVCDLVSLLSSYY